MTHTTFISGIIEFYYINDRVQIITSMQRNIHSCSCSTRDLERFATVTEGDIVFARTGSIGKTYLYKKEDGRCAFAGYLIRFIPNEKKFIQSSFFVTSIPTTTGDGSTQFILKEFNLMLMQNNIHSY
jgi:hypothetical protein